MDNIFIKQIDEIDPQCVNGSKPVAINNRGHLLPCCEWDTGKMIRDPYVQKLMAVSNIADADIDEILLTDEWQQFYQDITTGNYIPIMCKAVCGKGKPTRITRYKGKKE